MNLFADVAHLYPLSYLELKNYYNGNHTNEIIRDIESLLQMPFIFSIGIWIDFFKTNGIDLDTQSLDITLIQESVWECMYTLEKSISHYS